MIIFIKPYMIEPVSFSVGLYLVSKSKKYCNTRTLTRTLLRPNYINNKISKFIDENKELLLDAGKDEIIEFLIDAKIINFIKFSPSIALCIYIILFIISMFIF